MFTKDETRNWLRALLVMAAYSAGSYLLPRVPPLWRPAVTAMAAAVAVAMWYRLYSGDASREVSGAARAAARGLMWAGIFVAVWYEVEYLLDRLPDAWRLPLFGGVLVVVLIAFLRIQRTREVRD